MRRFLALTTTLIACVAAPGTAVAQTTEGRSGDNIVAVSPTVGSEILHSSRVKVSLVSGDTVDSTNLAQSTPHDCTGCEGIAVAFQAVIYRGSPSTFTPANAAIAYNQNCTSCGAFAYAYQYVVQADGTGRLSGDARSEIAKIRREARDDIDAGLPYPELDARLHDLAVRFRTVIREDLDRARRDPRRGRGFERQTDVPANG